MGCSSSTTSEETSTRRRLSVDHCEGETTSTTCDQTTEASRGAILQVETTCDQTTEASQGAILQAETLSVGDEPPEEPRRFCIGSITDVGKQSFSNKAISQSGDAGDHADLGMGFTCRKGLKPESPNQDSWVIIKVDSTCAIYGVFDGHGRQGHEVSNFVKENLPQLIIEDPRFRTDDMPQLLLDAFHRMQDLIVLADRSKLLSAQLSGTTCTVCIHDFQTNKLTIAHVADSTCCLSSFPDSTQSKISGVALTRDHKPDLPQERARIESFGGRVRFDGYSNYRVYAQNGNYPGLNMSRCLGDLLGHMDAGCSWEPEITERTVTTNDHILFLCSDGVWEFMSPQDAAEIVLPMKEPSQAMAAADNLAKEAWARWMKNENGKVVDDITALLIYLQHVGKDVS